MTTPQMKRKQNNESIPHQEAAPDRRQPASSGCFLSLNVAVLGVRAAIDMRGVAAIVFLALAGGAVAIFCAFHPMFSKLVKKNTQRIADLEGERHHVVRFFDRKSYLMMAIMMSFGIGMRAAGLFPDWFIAFFYTGLGLALSLAGASYIARGVRGRAWAFHGTD